MKKKITRYVPTVCGCCGQDTSYQLAMDRGSTLLVMRIAEFIGKKGINAVHPRKEMEGTFLTSNQVGNLSRPRFHGLIAATDGNPGNYCLTKKGAKFLHGGSIPQIAIVQKGTAIQGPHNIGYHMEEEYKVNLAGLLKDTDMWVGIDYSIEEGHVINKLQ